MSKPDGTHENLFSYGPVRALHAAATPVPGYELHVHEFIRRDVLLALRDALSADADILTTMPNTGLQNLLSPLTRQCLWELHSGIMLRLLENITGIKNLLPDTHCKQSCLLPRGEAFAKNPAARDSDTGLHASLVLLLLLDNGDAIIRNLSVPSSAGRTIGTDEASADKKNVMKIVYWTHQAASP
ncbi:MAG TPA: hypothetical protein PLF22_09310 [Pseudomonadales bacterium]|nr:hypothetical protein [Pseudomonadales bacterium]